MSIRVVEIVINNKKQIIIEITIEITFSPHLIIRPTSSAPKISPIIPDKKRKKR